MLASQTVAPDENSLPKSITCLVVDDEAGPRESLRMILSSRHEVLLASNGAEALEILCQRPVDVVCLDLNMPGMRGDELMHTVRRKFPQIEMIVITGCGTVESAVEGIRCGVIDYLAKPFDVIQVGSAVARAVERRESRRRLVHFLEGIGNVLGRNSDAGNLVARLDDSQLLQERLRAVLREPLLQAEAGEAQPGARAAGFLEVLAETIESRDACLRGHARRVAFLAARLSERLGLPAIEREQIRIAAFLHDLGKVAVPSDVIESPYALNAAQRKAIEQHPAIGERLVRPLGFAAEISVAIRQHHERWDGRGYPDGLREEEIPLAARIIAVPDAFDAMTCDRPYRAARPTEQALQELRDHAGSQFDPTLVAEFVAIAVSEEEDTDGPSPGSASIALSTESVDASTTRVGGIR